MYLLNIIINFLQNIFEYIFLLSYKKNIQIKIESIYLTYHNINYLNNKKPDAYKSINSSSLRF